MTRKLSLSGLMMTLSNYFFRSTFGISSAYEIVEGGAVSFVALDKCVFGYNGLEHMYTDEAFQFLLYFSHEDSVTAGSKALIESIHRAWPTYSSHFWDPNFL